VLLLEAAIQGDGIEAAKTILSGRSRTKIMILTALDDDAPVSRALRAGVHGYILKGITGNELIRAVKDVHSGEPYVTPQLAARLLMLSKSDALATKKKIADLSHREQQVLDCLCQGLTDKEIATRLNISRSTIRYYLALVFKKLNVRNRVEALQATDWLKTTSSSSL
jgi:DNA-binding NarL/FixJ family response regulator